MPHNIYLHSALVKSRDIDRTRTHKVAEANKYFAIESAVALGVSFVINLAVVSVFAKEFFDPICAVDGFARVDGICQSIGLTEAGDALHSILGGSARTVWAIGLLAAGQSSTMTGTYAGQFVMEGFLRWQIAPWKRVLITRSIALIPALTIAVITEDHPDAADQLGEWLNVLQSIQLPFALLPILHFTSSRRLMGQFVNGPLLQIVVWLVSLGALTINVYLVVNFITDPDSPTPQETWFFVFVALVGAAYFGFIGVIIWVIYSFTLPFHTRQRQVMMCDGDMITIGGYSEISWLVAFEIRW
jgi:Mn2+/Fe2+ NRAMP family transporter